MKKSNCILIIIMLLVTTHSIAQLSPNNQNYHYQLEQARKMKSGGATLTVLGGILMIAGGLTVRSSIRTGEANGETGAICYILGIGGIASGIPLMAVGASNQKKYNEKLQELSVRFGAGSLPRGLTLSYRF